MAEEPVVQQSVVVGGEAAAEQGQSAGRGVDHGAASWSWGERCVEGTPGPTVVGPGGRSRTVLQPLED
jgi:hypothetical protein